MVPLQLVVVKPVCRFLNGGYLDFGQSGKFSFALTEINYLELYLIRENTDENRSREAASTNAAKLEGVGARSEPKSKKKSSDWNITIRDFRGT